MTATMTAAIVIVLATIGALVLYKIGEKGKKEEEGVPLVNKRPKKIRKTSPKPEAKKSSKKKKRKTTKKKKTAPKRKSTKKRRKKKNASNRTK